MLHHFKLMHKFKKMHVELNEYRYYLEKNVARRTEYLSRRIELLEACNATLCSKLALSKKEFTTADGQDVLEHTAKLYLLNSTQVA